jgi:hypothetical protein
MALKMGQRIRPFDTRICVFAADALAYHKIRPMERHGCGLSTTAAIFQLHNNAFLVHP